MMPSGHKAFLVSNTNDVELLLMHNRTFAAEYVESTNPFFSVGAQDFLSSWLGHSFGMLTWSTGSPTTSPRESELTSSPAQSNSASRSRTPRRRLLLRSKGMINGECGDFGVYGFSIFGNHCIDAWEWFCSMVKDGHEPGMYFVLEKMKYIYE